MSYVMPGNGAATPGATGGGRRGRLLLPTLVVLALVVGGFVLFAGFWTDLLWFRSVDEGPVFSTLLWTRLGLLLGFAALMALIVGGNMWIAYRIRPELRGLSAEQANLEKYRIGIEPYRRLLFIGVPVGLGLFAGFSAAQEWKTWLLWRNAAPFGVTDPQFGLDVSYFTFVYPFQRFVLGFLFAAVVIAFIASLVVHYLYGGIKLQTPGERATAAAQAHLSVLIGVFCLLKAAAYWLDRYGLAISDDGLLLGLKYKDVNAVLPAKNILTVIALICAVLFFANAFRRTWALPIIGLGLLVLSSLLIGFLYPAIVQATQVSPSEVVKESPYIQRNIDATRTAYGIDKAKVTEYAANSTPKANAQSNDAPTLGNIRLLDPALVSPTYRQLQQIRGFYSFPDSLDIDRYKINSRTRGSVVAVRELDLTGVPERNWANDHIVYTHGYGFVAAYDNTSQSDGSPSFFESDIPPTGQLPIDQPRIYFGEESATYSIVGAPEGSTPRELDYPDDTSSTGQKNNTYDGKGGVPVGSFLDRLLFATKYQEPNIVLSDLINSDSKILYIREPRERVAKVAPWLTIDGDPYPAVVDGRVVWILDGYTTSDAYPYSDRTTLDTATSDSLTQRTSSVRSQAREQINYIRNSVKATVDAYDGTVTLFEWDKTDPVLKTWEGAFPGLVKSRDEIPASLLSHLRYPEDLFKVQRSVLSRYHVTDPSSFYSGQDFWTVPADPTQTRGDVAQPPYYLTLKMPDQKTPSFSLTTTFAPNKRQTLAAFMSVNADAGSDYGTIRVLQLPRNTTIPGPTQVQNNFESDPDVSRQLTLLRSGGSTVELGNLLSLPVGGGFLYVEPVYLRATGAQGYPQLKKVLAAYGNTVAFTDTLPQALAVIFKGNKPGGATPGGGGGGTTTTTPQAELVRALADAQTAYSEGQKALAAGDFAAYGVAQKKLKEALDRAAKAQEALTGSSVPTPTPSPTPSGTPTVTLPATTTG